MSKLLKLTGLASFMSVALQNVNVQRGEVIKVTDEQASTIITLHKMSATDDIEVPFFTEVPSYVGQLAYDFTQGQVQARPAVSVYKTVEQAQAEEQAERNKREAEAVAATQNNPVGVASDTGGDGLIEPEEEHSDLEVDPVVDPIRDPDTGHITQLGETDKEPSAPNVQDADPVAKPAAKKASQRRVR